MQLNQISWDPAQINGQACIRGMRVTMKRVFQLIADSDRKSLFADYPDRQEEDLQQALAYATANLEDPAEALRA
jgi:uncharacterized protein (DUF433 family)